MCLIPIDSFKGVGFSLLSSIPWAAVEVYSLSALDIFLGNAYKIVLELV